MVPMRESTSNSLDFVFLKQRVSIEQVLLARGLVKNLKRRGKRLVGPCPIHGGDNPRAFVVDCSKNLWRCFTHCGGGDVVELLRRIDGADYRAVALSLASLAAEDRPMLPPPPLPAFSAYRKKLPLDHTAFFLKSKGILPLTAYLFDAGAYRGRGALSGCVAVRLHGIAGEPLGYAGRRIDPRYVEEKGKWWFPQGFPKKTLLYGFHRLNERVEVVVVECPWGTMRLHQLGVPAVALMGTSLSLAQRDLLMTFRRVRLMLDGDAAGRNGQQQAMQALAALTQISGVKLPEGLDPDDLTDQELYSLLRD